MSKLKPLPENDPRVQRIRKAAKEKKIEFAPAEESGPLSSWIDKVMGAVGIEYVFISDESLMCDFFPFLEEDEVKEYESDLQSKLGVPVSMGDKVVDVARRLKAQSCPPS